MNTDMPSHLYQLQVILREKEAMLVKLEESFEKTKEFVKEWLIAQKEARLNEWAIELEMREHALTIRWEEFTGQKCAICVLIGIAILTVWIIAQHALGL